MPRATQVPLDATPGIKGGPRRVPMSGAATHRTGQVLCPALPWSKNHSRLCVYPHSFTFPYPPHHTHHSSSPPPTLLRSLHQSLHKNHSINPTYLLTPPPPLYPPLLSYYPSSFSTLLIDTKKKMNQLAASRTYGLGMPTQLLVGMVSESRSSSLMLLFSELPSYWYHYYYH